MLIERVQSIVIAQQVTSELKVQDTNIIFCIIQ